MGEQVVRRSDPRARVREGSPRDPSQQPMFQESRRYKSEPEPEQVKSSLTHRDAGTANFASDNFSVLRREVHLWRKAGALLAERERVAVNAIKEARGELAHEVDEGLESWIENTPKLLAITAQHLSNRLTSSSATLRGHFPSAGLAVVYVVVLFLCAFSVRTLSKQRLDPKWSHLFWRALSAPTSLEISEVQVSMPDNARGSMCLTLQVDGERQLCSRAVDVIDHRIVRFDSSFIVQVRHAQSKCVISVIDREGIMKGGSLAQVELLVHDLLQASKRGQYCRFPLASKVQHPRHQRSVDDVTDDSDDESDDEEGPVVAMRLRDVTKLVLSKPKAWGMPLSSI